MGKESAESVVILGVDPGAVMAGIWLAKTGFDVTWIPEKQTHSKESSALIPVSPLLTDWLKSVGIDLKLPHDNALGYEPMWLTKEHRVQWKQNKKLQLFDHLQEWGDAKTNEMQAWRYDYEDRKTKEQNFWKSWPRLQTGRFTNKNILSKFFSPQVLKDDGKQFWKTQLNHDWTKVLHESGDSRGFAWRSESYYLPDYVVLLQEKLKTTALHFGVKIIDEPIIAVHSRKSDVIEVHFEKRIQSFRSLILGMPWNEFSDRLVHLATYLENRPPVFWKFKTEAIVHREAIPSHLSPWLIWTEADAPSLKIHFDQSQDPVQITLETSLPMNDESLDPSRLKQISGRMFRKLNEFIPYLEFHLVRVNPDFRNMKDLEDVKTLIPYEKVSQIPKSLHEFSNTSLGIKTKIPGIYRCNGESFSSLGYLSSWVSALKIHAKFVSKEKSWDSSPRVKSYTELWPLSERTGE
ncbi:MAG: hypothetical protein KA715_07865 [Xanthomonadaceae bacterium]|nr:hypothetical protein [Xanthomonadaceae bacterium]